jgi:hypothetical protein
MYFDNFQTMEDVEDAPDLVLQAEVLEGKEATIVKDNTEGEINAIQETTDVRLTEDAKDSTEEKDANAFDLIALRFLTFLEYS